MATIVATIWDNSRQCEDARYPSEKVAEIRADLPLKYVHPTNVIVGLDKFIKLINDMYAGPYIEIGIYEENVTSRIIQSPYTK